MKLSKGLLLMVFVLTTITTMFSQGPISQGQTQVNLGVGFSNYGVPVYVGFDYGVHRDITLGAELSYRSFKERFQSERYGHSIIGVSGNVNYHFNTLFEIPKNWDLYAGLNIGFYHWTSDSNYPGSFNSGLGIGGQIGGRYYFTNKMGVNLEIGGGNAFTGGKIGITIIL
jgi:outer membrane protein W